MIFSELRTLYDQYLESRTKYFFFREQLSKELRLQGVLSVASQKPEESVIKRIDLTHMYRQTVQPAIESFSVPTVPTIQHIQAVNHSSVVPAIVHMNNPSVQFKAEHEIYNRPSIITMTDPQLTQAVPYHNLTSTSLPTYTTFQSANAYSTQHSFV